MFAQQGEHVPGQSDSNIQQQKEEQEESTPNGLAFLALISFIASFVTARVFATLNPNTVAMAGGIHFHHFWYGLIMVMVAGWAGIVYSLPAFKRIYAVVFGLGAGLIGDEIGLLLTFGDYHSTLTYFFFVIVVAVGTVAVLLRDRKKIRYDVIGLKFHERTLLAGVVIMGLSALAFGAGLLPVGVGIVGVGLAVTVAGILWQRAGR